LQLFVSLTADNVLSSARSGANKLNVMAGVLLDTDSKGIESAMSMKDRGFASMDPDKQRQIASKGGKTAHQSGVAHQWTREEARVAGRKGGIASRDNKRARAHSPNSIEFVAAAEQKGGDHDGL
jgi:general stress protein YciG